MDDVSLVGISCIICFVHDNISTKMQANKEEQPHAGEQVVPRMAAREWAAALEPTCQD